MPKMTSAQAAKELKRLNELHDALLEQEKKSAVFTAAIQEDIELARPTYDYSSVQSELQKIEGQIMKLKHSISSFNLTYVIPEFNITIDQMLIYLPQLTARKKKLEKMAGRLPKERLSSGFHTSNFIEYMYCNYDVNEVKSDLAKTAQELSAAQTALDLANTTVEFDVDI